MRKLLLVLTLAGATMVAPGLTPAAHAYGWFSIGTGFRVGPLSLSFVLGQPFRGYAPAYYYRAYQPIAYPGYHCTDRCFVDHGVYYHDRGCPVVRHYLAQYRVDPYDSYVRYAPRYDGYYDNGYYERHGAYYGGGYGYDGYYGGGYGGGLYVDGSIYLGGSRGYRGYYNRGYSGYRDYDRRDFGRRDNDRREDRREFRNEDRRDFRNDDRRDRGDRRDHGDRGDRGDRGSRDRRDHGGDHQRRHDDHH